MNKQQELLVQVTERLMKGFDASFIEMENPKGSLFKCMYELIVERSRALKPVESVWIEAMCLVANAALIHQDGRTVVGISGWKTDDWLVSSQVVCADTLIQAAIRNCIHARTSKIINLQHQIGDVSDELEDISSLIGRV